MLSSPLFSRHNQLRFARDCFYNRIEDLTLFKLLVLFYLLAFVLVISLIVFTHEFGHYFFAKFYGVKVEEFSIGFGKEIFGFYDKSGTRWKFCTIPAGGYVKMFGDADKSSSPNEEKLLDLSESDKKLSLHFKPVYQKAMVAFGGPLANFIFAFFILFGLYFSFGKQFVEPVVTSLESGSAAEMGGVKVNDRILKIDGVQVNWFEDISKKINLNRGEDLKITVLRDKENIELIVKPKIFESKDVFGNDISVAKVGIISDLVIEKKLGIISSCFYSALEIKEVMTSTLKMLAQIIAGKRESDSLGGPIRIAKYSAQSLKKGFVFFVWFLAMLSINLGLVNLFPIPMLDGGHLLFYLLEAFKGSPISLKTQEIAAKVGFVVVLGIFAFATFNDIFFIFK